MSNAPASTGPAAPITTLASKLISTDGTFSITAQPYRGDGIIVALPGVGIVLSAHDYAADNAAARASQWLADVAVPEILSRPAPFHRPRYVGSWLDGSDVYLDVVEIFSRDEIEEAKTAGFNRNQIAIWDNGAQELINTGGTGAVE